MQIVKTLSLKFFSTNYLYGMIFFCPPVLILFIISNFFSHFVFASSNEFYRPYEYYEETLNGVAFDFVKIPGGFVIEIEVIKEINEKFFMKLTQKQEVKKEINEDFFIMTTPITQEQYKAIMDSPSYRNPSYRKGKQYPIEQVSFFDAQKFIEKLNAKGMGTFRLPKQEEWLYVVNTGDSNGVSKIDHYPWWEEYSNKESPLAANPWGIYFGDKFWEWTKSSIDINNKIYGHPHPKVSGYHIVCSNSQNFLPASSYLPDDNISRFLGFRVVKEIPKTSFSEIKHDHSINY